MKPGTLLKTLRRHVDACDTTMALTIEQRVFLAASLTKFVDAATSKFIAGQKEHGGMFWERPLFKELEDELIDAWFYKDGIRKKLDEI